MSWEPGAEPDGEPFDLEHNGPRASPVELDCRGCNVPTVVIEQLDHGTHDTQQPLQRLETPQKPQVERQRTPEKPKFAHVDPDLPDATAPCFDDEDPARAAHGARFCAEGDAQSSGANEDPLLFDEDEFSEDLSEEEYESETGRKKVGARWCICLLLLGVLGLGGATTGVLFGVGVLGNNTKTGNGVSDDTARPDKGGDDAGDEQPGRQPPSATPQQADTPASAAPEEVPAHDEASPPAERTPASPQGTPQGIPQATPQDTPKATPQDTPKAAASPKIPAELQKLLDQQQTQLKYAFHDCGNLDDAGPTPDLPEPWWYYAFPADGTDSQPRIMDTKSLDSGGNSSSVIYDDPSPVIDPVALCKQFFEADGTTPQGLPKGVDSMWPSALNTIRALYASWESGNRQDNPPLRAKDAVKQLWRFKTLWGNRGACHKAAPYWLQDFLKSVEFATLSYNLDRIK